MLKKRRRIAVIMAMILMLSCVSVNAASPTVKLKKYTAPKTLLMGQSFSLKGKIKSKIAINRVEIGVVKSNGKWTKYKYDKKKLNKKSFNIKKADSKIRFGKLKKGTYYYRVYVHLKGKKRARLLLNRKFTVIDAPTQEFAPTELLSSTGKAIIKVVGGNAPGNYSVGQIFNIKGILLSNENIKKIEIGIVYAPTNKWTDFKADYTVNANTFDISKADPEVKFSKLGGGTYYYRIYAHTTSGITVVANKKFTVTPSDKPMKAVKWATKIANDDSFSYGKRPKTNKNGCYFCGTNKKNKPKGYEKTYVCSTFVHAAYAHGAKDPELLRDCKSGKYCLSLTDSNMRNYSCWMKVGLAKDLKPEDLQPGDVICAYAPSNFGGHLAIYAGDGKIIDASGDGFGADTIKVRKNYAQKMLNYAKNHHSKSYVMRYNK